MVDSNSFVIKNVKNIKSEKGLILSQNNVCPVLGSTFSCQIHFMMEFVKSFNENSWKVIKPLFGMEGEFINPFTPNSCLKSLEFSRFY